MSKYELPDIEPVEFYLVRENENAFLTKTGDPMYDWSHSDTHFTDLGVASRVADRFNADVLSVVITPTLHPVKIRSKTTENDNETGEKSKKSPKIRKK